MVLLDEETKKQLANMFAGLKDKVKLIYFKPEGGCETCGHIESLVKEVAEVGDFIDVEIYVFEKDKEIAEKYKIDKAPAIVIVGKTKGLVRYFGIPSGHEFSAFIQDIIDASTGEIDLPEDLKEKVKEIDFPVHLQVFVTPTCPYCPSAVKLAHDLAFLNENVVADMIEALEYRELAMKYAVSGVPKTVVNDKIEFEGAYPPDIVIKRILELKGK